jgi:hypothetical protein
MMPSENMSCTYLSSPFFIAEFGSKRSLNSVRLGNWRRIAIEEHLDRLGTVEDSFNQWFAQDHRLGMRYHDFDR